MDKNIILAGVGGQGILSIAYVIDNAALDAGYEFKQAEVHGMAQRGGAVQSHLRYADHEIHSDLVPTGRADLVISVEPLEALRYWHFLAPSGWVVSSVTPYVNIPDYPPVDEVVRELAAFGRTVLVDSAQLARAAGNLRAQNMVVVGAASPLLDFTEEQLLTYVRRLFAAKGEKTVEVNCRAFHLGRTAGLMFRRLADGGLPPLEALKLCQKFAPETIDPACADGWLEALARRPGALELLLAQEGTVACDQPSLPA